MGAVVAVATNNPAAQAQPTGPMIEAVVVKRMVRKPTVTIQAVVPNQRNLEPLNPGHLNLKHVDLPLTTNRQQSQVTAHWQTGLWAQIDIVRVRVQVDP
jgi:hypothetical protein